MKPSKSMRQHEIDPQHTITDQMTTGASGTWFHDLVGRTVVTAYHIPDSDRSETLLLLDDERVLMVSCDPGYADDDVTRTPDKWEVVMYDATDTPAAEAMRQLEPGQWL